MTDPGWANTAPGASSTALVSLDTYPVTAGLEAPLEIARWRVIGNAILAIPHFIILYVLRIVAELMVIVAWFSVLFTGKMPPGLGNFIAGVERYQWRVTSYLLFLREQYPPFSVPTGYPDPGGDPAWLNIQPPQQFSRLAVLLRVIYIIPQALFGIILVIGLYVAWIVGFFAVLITGKWPSGLRTFIVGIMFWSIRVNCWYVLLADPYPPFSIN